MPVTSADRFYSAHHAASKDCDGRDRPWSVRPDSVRLMVHTTHSRHRGP